MQLIRDIEKKVLAARGVIERSDFISIDAAAPAEVIPSGTLLEQVYTDGLKLALNTHRALQNPKLTWNWSSMVKPRNMLICTSQPDAASLGEQLNRQRVWLPYCTA